MTVALLNGYSSHNVGDWLLFENSLDVIKHLHPGEPILAFAMDSRSFQADPQAEVSISASPVTPEHLARSVLGTLLALISGARLGPRHLRELRDSAVHHAYSAGGGFLQMRSSRELVTVTLVHLSQLALCRRLNIRVTMLPQSVGPFHGRPARFLARRIMRWFDVVMVRESKSLSHLRELNPGLGHRVVLVPDLAFWSFAPKDKGKEPQTASARPKVGLVIRQWWFPGEPDPASIQQRYLQRAAALIEELRRGDADVRLIVHSDGPTSRGDDRISTDQVLQQLSSPIPVEMTAGLPSINDAMEHYATYDAIVSSRLHASIMSLMVGVPAIALGYEWKSEGIYQQLELGRWHHPIGAWEVASVQQLIDQRDSFPWTEVNRHLADFRQELSTAIRGQA